jgi:hypothetical protein
MQRGNVWLFFGLTFGLTWGVGVLYLLFGSALTAAFGPLGVHNPFFYLAVWSPAICAVLLAALQGRAGLSDLFGRLVRFNIGWQWYVLPTLGIAVIAFAARTLAAYYVGAPSPLAMLTTSDGSPWLISSLLMFVVDPGPLGEELGWRGFALPRLERRWSGLVAALVLGTIWGIWHLPAFFISGLPQSSFGFPMFLVQSIAFTVLLAWMVNNARGSVIPAILLHWAINRFAGLDDKTMPFTCALFVSAAILVVIFAGRDLGRARMPTPPT